MQQRHRLFQVDDVNAVALPENEGSHAGIPAAGRVAEMNASLQELTHREIRQRHRRFRLRLIHRGRSSPVQDTGTTVGDVSPAAESPRVRFTRCGI